MLISVRTEGDVEYFIDTKDLQWERSGKNTLRTNYGDLSEAPKMVVGERMTLLGPGLKEGTYRRIVTSPVVSIGHITGKPQFPLSRFFYTESDGLLPLP